MVLTCFVQPLLCIAHGNTNNNYLKVCQIAAGLLDKYFYYKNWYIKKNRVEQFLCIILLNLDKKLLSRTVDLMSSHLFFLTV